MIPRLALLLVCVAVASGNPGAGKQGHWKSPKPVVTPKGSAKSGRIVGGKEATPHSFPHQVALFYYEDRFYCSGSLISPEWILTAAHCLDSHSIIHAVMGAHSIIEEEDSQIRMQCIDFIIHDDYDFMTESNDIGLIKLYQPVPFSDEIAAVGLPSADVAEGDIVTATGWGHYSDDFYDDADTLRQVDVSVLSKVNCYGAYGFNNEKDLCTDPAGGRGTCTHDDGGPLNKDGKIYGISKSHGIVGCEAGMPSFFTSVYDYLDWIQEHTGVTP